MGFQVDRSERATGVLYYGADGNLHEQRAKAVVLACNDIWVVRIGSCAFTFHDKKGHMIQPQKHETTD